MIGDRNHGFVGEMFARNGIGAAIISYRLSPKVLHPGHIQDTAKAFAWVKKNIGKYGGKADQVFVSGHSAGGHRLARLATDETYLKAEGLALTDIKGVMPLSGVYVIAGGLAAPIFGRDPDVLKKASPLEQVKDKHPPFLVIWGDRDLPGLDGMAKLCAKLKDNKCDVESKVMKDRTHVTLVSNMRKDDDPLCLAAFDFIEKHSSWSCPAKDSKE